MRLEDESEPIRDAVSAEYADLVIAVTELGGPAVLMVLLAVAFWVGDRRRTALVISYAVAGLGFYLTLETLFAIPRPPEEALLTSFEVDGYGFPSGHAFSAVVVYGGLVAAYDRLRDPLVVAAATTLIVAVSLSRVVLGVHYLGDVIAGAALGIAFVAAMNRLTHGVPVVGFGIGVAAALPAVYLSGTAAYDVLALGAAVGGLLTAGWIDRLPDPRSRLEVLVLVAAGVGGVVGLQAVEGTLEFAPLVVACYATLVAWIMIAPAVVDRLTVKLDAVRARA